MTRLAPSAVALALILAAPAVADDKPAPGADPMAGWKPPVVKDEKKDLKEIEAALKKMETAGKKADLDAAMALIDFPVLMVTDNAKGEAGGAAWSQEQWVEVMKPFYAKPMPEGSVAQGKRTVVLISDSLALVGSGWTMKMGPKKVSGTSGLLLIRKGGEWKVKGMVEGGWGDMPMPGTKPAEAAAPAK